MQARLRGLERSCCHSGESDRNNNTLLCSRAPPVPFSIPHSVWWPLSGLDQHVPPHFSCLMLFLSQKTLGQSETLLQLFCFPYEV